MLEARYFKLLHVSVVASWLQGHQFISEFGYWKALSRLLGTWLPWKTVNTSKIGFTSGKIGFVNTQLVTSDWIRDWGTLQLCSTLCDPLTVNKMILKYPTVRKRLNREVKEMCICISAKKSWGDIMLQQLACFQMISKHVLCMQSIYVSDYAS